MRSTQAIGHHGAAPRLPLGLGEQGAGALPGDLVAQQVAGHRGERPGDRCRPRVQRCGRAQAAPQLRGGVGGGTVGPPATGRTGRPAPTRAPAAAPAGAGPGVNR